MVMGKRFATMSNRKLGPSPFTLSVGDGASSLEGTSFSIRSSAIIALGDGDGSGSCRESGGVNRFQLTFFLVRSTKHSEM